jgi:hypothetical protein
MRFGTILGLALCLSLAGCAKPYSAQLAAVDKLLIAARSGDEAGAEALMPALREQSASDRKKVLAGLAALGEHEVSGIARSREGFLITLRFGRGGAARTITFPLVASGKTFAVGDAIATEEHIDLVPLDSARPSPPPTAPAR